MNLCCIDIDMFLHTLTHTYLICSSVFHEGCCDICRPIIRLSPLWVSVDTALGVCVRCTSSADPHLALLFGVRNGGRGERKPQGKPKRGLFMVGGNLSSFFCFILFLSCFCIHCQCPLFINFLICLFEKPYFILFFILTLSFSSLSLGVRSVTVKIKSYKCSFTFQQWSNKLIGRELQPSVVCFFFYFKIQDMIKDLK